jgi:hypothetical protein
MDYQQLSSEKYWLESVNLEQQQQLKERRRNWIKALVVNTSALVIVTGLVMFAIETMPGWLPTLASFMNSR